MGVLTKVTSPRTDLFQSPFFPQTQTTFYFSLMYILKAIPSALQGEKSTCSSSKMTFSYTYGWAGPLRRSHWS